MNSIDEISSRHEYPKLYTIHSQKGGVGKTSVAIGIAGLEAIFNRKRVLLIDADLTGTSLVDMQGLPIDFTSKKFFNDLMLASPDNFEIATNLSESNNLSTYYAEINEDSYRELIFLSPGSPFYKAILPVIPLISQEDHLHFFSQRLEDILATAVKNNFDVIILDLPPGLFGISNASLRICFENSFLNLQKKSRLAGLLQIINSPCIKSQAVLVTTPDKVDHVALMHFFDAIFKNWCIQSNLKINELSMKGHVHLLINKAIASTGGRFDPIFSTEEVFKNIRLLKTEREVTEKLVTLFEEEVRSSGPYACQYITDFSMNQILNILPHLKSKFDDRKADEVIDGTSLWCKQLYECIIKK